MTHSEFKQWLENEENDVCDPAQEWVAENGYSEVEAWQHFHRADWMLWLAARRPWGDHVKIVRCACACARTALMYVPNGEDRPRLAIEAAEKWCENPSKGNAAAAADAADAARAAADAAAYAAAYAAARAGIAAADAAADAAAYAAAYAAARAGIAVAARAAAAAASVVAANAAAARAGIAAADAAYAAANAEMAEIVRGIITVEDVARVEEGKIMGNYDKLMQDFIALGEIKEELRTELFEKITQIDELTARIAELETVEHLEKQQLQDEKDSLTLALSKSVQRIAELEAAAKWHPASEPPEDMRNINIAIDGHQGIVYEVGNYRPIQKLWQVRGVSYNVKYVLGWRDLPLMRERNDT
jgi:hypothetical protein